jgi:hypothetical protein
VALVVNPSTGNLDVVFDNASEIKYDSTVSGLGTLDVQSAIDKVQSNINSLPTPISYKGVWNASTNTPFLSNTDVGKSGYLYQVTVAGTHDFGSGPLTFLVNDKVVNEGNQWDRWDQTDAVTSVQGFIGAVNLISNNIPEGATNLYFQNQRAQDAVGNILTDTVTIGFTYDGANHIVSAIVKDASITDVKVASGINATKIADGSVSNVVFQYLSGVTSPIQTQLNTKASASGATITNAIIGDTNTVILKDTNFTLEDDLDTTKKLQFQLSSITTGTSRVLTIPDANTTLVGTDNVQTLTNKSISAANNTISNITNISISAVAGIDATKLADGSVTNTELQYVHGLTSPVQTQLNNKQPLSTTLTSLSTYNTNGLITQTAPNTFTGRTLTPASTKVSVVNGDGVAGNPIVDIVESNLSLNNISGTLGIAKGGTGTVTTPTNGQLLIGNAGSYAVANLTPGTGISISNTPGAIVVSAVSANANDIPETIFTATTSASPVSVTGASFSNAAVRSFVLRMNALGATSTYQNFEITGIQRGADWVISQQSLGDNAGITFSITTTGQLQYISNNNVNLRFKAATISV